MESPLRFSYLVELNLDSEHAKHFQFTKMFGGDALSYSLFSSKFYKSHEDCITLISDIAKKQKQRLMDLDQDSAFTLISGRNESFSTALFAGVEDDDDDIEMFFDEDELYKLSVFDVVNEEPVITFVLQVSDHGSDETLHFSGEIH